MMQQIMQLIKICNEIERWNMHKISFENPPEIANAHGL